MWSWGDGPTVLLVHGWNGRASQLSGFIGPLVDRGYRVVAFDAPAHGESPGKQTTIPEMVRALHQVSAELGEIHGVIAHSMGGAATLLAIDEGFAIERAVLIAPPSDPALFVTHFARALGLSRELELRLRANIERRAGRRLEELRVDRLTPSKAQSLLVIHDEDDSQVPIEHGISIAETWPNASLVATQGLGHRRILRDAYVNKRSVGFIDAPLRAERTAA
ncbi:MAG: alpha/beta fold hydrolase [Myxococcota bacterium]